MAWHVKPGDTVAEDAVLAEVMTDKASVEIPSPVAGRVVELGGEVGQTLAVGSKLIRLEVAGADETPRGTASRPPAPAAPHAPAHPPRAHRSATSAISAAAAAAAAAAEAPEEAPPARPEPRAQHASPVRPAAETARTSAPPSDRPIASPAVRRRAWELGVDLASVPASGPGGRIMQADLEAHAAAHGKRPLEQRPPAPLAERNDEETIAIVGLRRKIAQKMQESKRRIPHYSYVEEVDVTELEALRARLNQRNQDQAPRLTLLPFLMRAVVLAVRDIPATQCPLRRRSRQAHALRRGPPRHRDADAQWPDGAGGAPCRVARPVVQRGRSRAACRGRALGQGHARGVVRIDHHDHQPRRARRAWSRRR